MPNRENTGQNRQKTGLVARQRTKLRCIYLKM